MAAFCLGTAVGHAASPTVVNVVPVPGSVTSLAQIAVTFSTPVANVVATDLLVSGFPAADEVNQEGAVYTFTLGSPPPYGPVSISWDPAHGITEAGNPGNRFDETAVSSTWQYNFIDVVAPTITGLIPSAGVSVRSLSQIEVRFTEGVAGVEASDLLVNNSPATGLAVISSD